MPDDLKNVFSELTSFVTFRLARTQNKLNAQATAILKSRSDLSLVEWRIILIVQMLDGASMSQIASELQIDKGQLSRKVAAMTKKGLIFSQMDENDQRIQHLHLTPESKELAAQLTPVMQERQRRLLQGVEPRDAETFFRVLARIEKASGKREIGPR
ncbi:MAG: MarR family transcriptional regulator [Pseudomonadota bacterium]